MRARDKELSLELRYATDNNARLVEHVAPFTRLKATDRLHAIGTVDDHYVPKPAVVARVIEEAANAKNVCGLSLAQNADPRRFGPINACATWVPAVLERRTLRTQQSRMPFTPGILPFKWLRMLDSNQRPAD